jgi:CRP-like cAMP-binding protein
MKSVQVKNSTKKRKKICLKLILEGSIMLSLAAKIRKNDVFKLASDDEQESLLRFANEVSYQKDEWITLYGDTWPYLFMVESGEVTAIKESSEGRNLIVLTLKEGDLFWGLAFFIPDTPNWVGFQANEETRLVLWSKEDVQPVLENNGKISWQLTCMLVARMQRASEIVEELAFQPVTGRLARLLLDHFGDVESEYIERDLRLDEMAARIGTTKEVVCRQLYKLADKGIIGINRTEFMISNADMLKELAQKGKA